MGATADSDPSTPSPREVGAAPAGLEPGQRTVVAGRYRLLDHIAEGGMGSVYVAEHTLSRKRLALKVVHPYLCRGRQGVERFRREVSAAAEIDHPGIVQVYDAGVDDDGGFFMAMELLEGESLGDRLRHDWPGMATAVNLVEGMLEPLAKAHAKNFIHRDLKPDNVFLAIDSEGRQRVKLLDFGLAREMSKGGPTQTGITFGTPEYMSPEQAISARKVRAPGDVWSVGVMLYELLSGVHPFTGETPNAIMANAIKEPLPPLRGVAPHVPKSLAALVERCLEKNPDRRPQNAKEMLEGLREVLARVELDETVPAVSTEPDSLDSDGPELLVSSPSTAARAAKAQAGLPTQIVDREKAEGAGSRTASSRRRAIVLGVMALVSVGMAGIAGASIYLRRSAGTATDRSGASVTEQAIASGEERSRSAGGPNDSSPESDLMVGEAEAARPDRSARPEEATEQAVGDEPTAPGAAEDEAREVSETDPRAAAQGRPEPGADSPAQARRRERRTRRSTASSDPVPPSGPSALDQARRCMAQNDPACARAALEAGARTAVERAMLIDLYRSSGRIPQALDAMEQFVRRFPEARQTASYREYLRRYGR